MAICRPIPRDAPTTRATCFCDSASLLVVARADTSVSVGAVPVLSSSWRAIRRRCLFFCSRSMSALEWSYWDMPGGGVILVWGCKGAGSGDYLQCPEGDGQDPIAALVRKMGCEWSACSTCIARWRHGWRWLMITDGMTAEALSCCSVGPRLACDRRMVNV